MKYFKINSVMFFFICCLQIGYCQVNTNTINSNANKYSPMNNPVYYLETTSQNCIVKAEINGFPFYALNAQFKSYFASPMNIGLVKGNNKITVNIIPVLENLTYPVQQQISVEMKLKVYENGDISSPENGKVLKEETITHYGTFQYMVNNQSQIDFSDFFNSIEAVEDTAGLKKYTELIVQSIKEKNMTFLKEEFAFKLRQYAQAFYIDSNIYLNYGFDFLENYILKYPPQNYVLDNSMIIYHPYWDKKIWYCSLSNGEELIYSGEDEDGNQHFIPVYISKIDGRFKIIR